MTLGQAARQLQDGLEAGRGLGGGLGDERWAFCSLTVYLRASPLSSGFLVGGTDGVSHCRQWLKQRVKRKILKKTDCQQHLVRGV